jgi:hypothetical protein
MYTFTLHNRIINTIKYNKSQFYLKLTIYIFTLCYFISYSYIISLKDWINRCIKIIEIMILQKTLKQLKYYFIHKIFFMSVNKPI